MKKPTTINPWEIGFRVIYRGRYALFENRELVRATLNNIAHLQGCECYVPNVPCILSESAGKDAREGKEIWIEDCFFLSGENPPMPRYMFARLIASVFQQYMQKDETPFGIYQLKIAETNTLGLSKIFSRDDSMP